MLHEFLQPLDPDQRLVASTFGQPVMVIAGAGTGKTRAITYRLAHGAATGAINPAKTLAVTFTTKAAGELKDRLRKLGILKVQARTFHSAALRMARYFWPKAYGTDLPEVSSNRLGMIAESCRRLGIQPESALLRDLSTEVSWAKCSNVTAELYPSLAEKQHRQVAGLDQTEVGRVLQAYEQVKRQNERIDFDDILLCVLAMMHEHPAVTEQIRARYEYFVVDEFQDVSPVQYRLLDAWLGGRNDICVVGDPKQSIHGFAGASPRYFQRFVKDNPDAVTIKLNRDYRSSPQIVQLANQVSGDPNGLKSMNPDGPEPIFESELTDPDQAVQVVKWLQSLHDEGIPWQEMAVLYRINAQSASLELELSKVGIPYQVRGNDEFYSRAEVKQALRNLTRQIDTPSEDPIEQVEAVLGQLGWTSTPPKGFGEVRGKWESWSALLQLAKDKLEENPAWGYDEIVKALNDSASIEHSPQLDGVTLTTLHSSKGLEWEAVALYSIDDQSLPFVLAETKKQIQEERRLLYVGITRAKNQLRISWCAGHQGKRPISRFLAGIVPARTQTFNPKPKQRTKQRRSLHEIKCRVCGFGLTNGSELKLGRHETCQATYSEEVLDDLVSWRKARSQADKVPAFVVFTDATLIAVAEQMPKDSRELLKIGGIGMVKLERYGQEVLQILAKHRSNSPS